MRISKINTLNKHYYYPPHVRKKKFLPPTQLNAIILACVIAQSKIYDSKALLVIPSSHTYIHIHIFTYMQT